MKKFLFVIPALVIAGAVTSLATSPAMAAPETIVIDTAAYNVRSSAGYELLASRVGRAARSVCGNVHDRDLRRIAASRRCQETAFADGMQQLDALAGQGSVTVGASR